MKGLSRSILSFKQSGIRKMFNMTYGMKDIISFAIGEPDFSAPARAVLAANKCNDSGFTKYTPNAGLLSLREKIADSLQEYGIKANPEREIIVTVGGMESLYMIMLVLLNPEDEVIVTDPYWCNYCQQVSMVGGVPVCVPVYEKDGFAFDPGNVRKAVTDKTKMILINSPANPTGGVTDLPVLKELAKIAVEHDLYVLTDEVYKSFLYDGRTHHSIAALPGMKERTLLVDSLSKTYAMTGWRVGYTAGPEEIIAKMVIAQEGLCSSVNSSAQLGAIAALESPPGELEELLALFDRRRRLIVDGFNSIKNISCRMPAGAFYAFPNISATGMSSEDFAVSLLKKEGVVLIPGSAFGDAGEGFLRLSYATSDENIMRGVEKVERFVRDST